MSKYDKETSKIYLDLNPTTPQEPQTYRLKKLTEIESYLLDEIEVCERLAKEMKRFNTITSIMNSNLITSTVNTGGVSNAHLQVVSYYYYYYYYYYHFYSVQRNRFFEAIFTILNCK